VLSLFSAIIYNRLSFICHDGRVLRLLARHYIDAQSFASVMVNFLAQNLVNGFQVHSAVSLLLCDS